MIYAYPCDLQTDEDGWFVATFPDVAQAITGGPSRDEALRLAADALAVALAGYLLEGREIPEPTELATGQELVAVPTVVAAKLALYSAIGP